MSPRAWRAPRKWPDLGRLHRKTPREKSKLLGKLFLNFQACIPPAPPLPHPPEMDEESVPDEKSTEISLGALSAPTLRSGGSCLLMSPHPLFGCPGHRHLFFFCPHLHCCHLPLLSLSLGSVISYPKTPTWHPILFYKNSQQVSPAS